LSVSVKKSLASLHQKKNPAESFEQQSNFSSKGTLSSKKLKMVSFRYDQLLVAWNFFPYHYNWQVSWLKDPHEDAAFPIHRISD